MPNKNPKFKVVYRPLDQMKPLENNPRWIKKEDFDRLCASVQNNPELFEAQPIILSNRTGENVIIACNQRYRAAIEVGLKEVPTILLEGLTEAKEKEIIIRTNVTNGKWDFDVLASGLWGDVDELTDWGVEMSFMEGVDDGYNEPNQEEDKADDSIYSRNVEIPIYKMTGEQPSEDECVDTKRVYELIDEINKSNVSEKQKEMLRVCAYRHAVINFANMAEYYAHQEKQMQQLMENNTLVLIDFDKAVENGFVEMTKKLLNIIPDAGKHQEEEIDYDEE